MHLGSCLCGSIRYSIDDELRFVVNCHCHFCSKAHGAAFVTLLFMPFAKFEMTVGQELLASYEVKTANAVRCFCSLCGTRLYNHMPSTGMISLALGTLDTDAEVHPIAHINTESKCSWYNIGDELPQFDSVSSPSEFALLRGVLREALLVRRND